MSGFTTWWRFRTSDATYFLENNVKKRHERWLNMIFKFLQYKYDIWTTMVLIEPFIIPLKKQSIYRTIFKSQTQKIRMSTNKILCLQPYSCSL